MAYISVLERLGKVGETNNKL